MLRLPPHHIPRPRLTQRCAGYQIVVVEAAGGYGKSVFAAELVSVWRSVGVWLQLDHGGVTAPLLASRLLDAARRAGVRSNQSCTFVIDDAHNALDDAGRLLPQLADQLEGNQRLVVLGRHLPEGGGRLDGAEHVQLTGRDLALDADETLDLCRSGFGLDLGPDVAEALGQATGGWTAATVLAAARAARAGETVAAVVEAATGPGHPSGAVAAMLDEALVALGPSSWPLLAQMAHYPLLDAGLVSVVSGGTGLFERALRAGIPFVQARGQWWDLPGPVRHHLGRLSPRDEQAMRMVAAEYRKRGELGPCVALLLASGDPRQAAAVLASTTPEQEESFDIAELCARFEQLPEAAVDEHPEVLLLVARRLSEAGRYSLGCELLDRARDIARHTAGPMLDRAAAAELVKVRLLAEMKYAAATEAARAVLDEVGPDEQRTRARANEYLGCALCRSVDSAGRRDEAALAEAEDCFALASDLYLGLGMRSAAALIAVDWAVHLEFQRGHVSAARDRIEHALPLTVDRPEIRGILLAWRTLFAAEVGDDELCQTSGDEALRLGVQTKSSLLIAQVNWKLAVAASYRGDHAATLHHLREAELGAGATWELLASDFLSEASQLLDRVGHATLALEYLARAKTAPSPSDHLVVLAEAALEARHGDPVLAERRLVALAQRRLDAREQWRVTLLRAYAAFRRGETDQAGALAARAIEQAALLGQHKAPMVRERGITEQLAALAASAGQPSAFALKASALPMSLVLLGRFELAVAGRSIVLAPGQQVRLLKYVAVSGGQVHSEQAIEAIWPEAGRAEGRNRLGTVLHRLRSAAGDVLIRSGEMMALGPHLRVDLMEFRAEAERALALAGTEPARAAAIARGAMARYQGDLLPDDLFEEWAERPRQGARSAMLDLLDLCAKDAANRDDLEALRRAVELAVQLDL